MRKLALICSLLFALNATTQSTETEPYNDCEELSVVYATTTIDDNYIAYTDNDLLATSSRSWMPTITAKKEFDIHSVEYIEDEVALNFEFDLEARTPRGFDPNEAYFDIHSIEYIEDEVALDFNFDLKEHTPRGFNPNEAYFDIHSVEYIEDEVELSFEFDLEDYTPRGFNPSETYFDIHSIEYIEDEVELEFNFDLQAYLPKNFNAYAKPGTI